MKQACVRVYSARWVRLARTFDWDYLKPQPRAQAFAEMWGLTYRPSTERAREFVVTDAPLADARDVARMATRPNSAAVTAARRLSTRAEKSL